MAEITLCESQVCLRLSDHLSRPFVPPDNEGDLKPAELNDDSLMSDDKENKNFQS